MLENGEFEGRGIYFAYIGLTFFSIEHCVFLFLKDMVALKRVV